MSWRAAPGLRTGAGDAALRHVRRLRLSAPSAQAERRALRVLEESLRLIALPGEAAGKTFYFRRLRLPPLRPEDNTTRYADQVETKCREMAQSALHFSHPAARSAEVVFAWSPIEPYQELARHIVHAAELDGWFWRAALSEDLQIALPGSSLEVLLKVADRHGDEGVLEFLGGVERNVLHSIFHQIEPQHLGPGRLQNLVRREEPPRARQDLDAGSKLLARLPALWRDLAREYAVRWNLPGDSRLHWLITAAWLLAEPERALDRRMPAQVAAIVGALLEEAQQRATLRRTASGRDDSIPGNWPRPEPLVLPSHRSEAAHQGGEAQEAFAPSGIASEASQLAIRKAGETSLAASPPPRRTAPAPATAIDQPLLHQDDTAAEASANLPGMESSGSEASLLAIRKAGETSLAASPPPPGTAPAPAAIDQPLLHQDDTAAEASDVKGQIRPDVALRTACAGFFFCLGLLDRMGIAETLASHPELIDLGFVRRLLRELALATGAKEEDPVVRQELWLNDQLPMPNDADAPLTFSASLLPIAWRRRTSRVRVPAWPLKKLVRAWVLAVRQKVWRASGMHLAAMAVRAGEFTATRTHLEIIMPQSSLEVRLRKAGFDVNPGWLPWLGRVVAFQYSCPVMEVIPAGAERHRVPTTPGLPHGARRNTVDQESGG
jgi:hypothetical protein